MRRLSKAATFLWEINYGLLEMLVGGGMRKKTFFFLLLPFARMNAREITEMVVSHVTFLARTI